MSKDSSATYLHMHSSRLADLFEDFCRPPSASATATNNSSVNPTAATNTAQTGDPSTTQLPGHFLPFEEIHLPSHLMPLNPEDEDDVVPDMHAAFGITRALGQNGVGGAAAGDSNASAVQREPMWRDLGLERLVDGGPRAVGLRRTGVGEGKRAGRLATSMMR